MTAVAVRATSQATASTERRAFWTVAQLRRRCGGLTAPELARRAGVPLRAVYLMEIGGAVSREEARRVLGVLSQLVACAELGEIKEVGGFIEREELQQRAWRVLTESDFRLFVYGNAVPFPTQERAAEDGASGGTGNGASRGGDRAAAGAWIDRGTRMEPGQERQGEGTAGNENGEDAAGGACGVGRVGERGADSGIGTGGESATAGGGGGRGGRMREQGQLVRWARSQRLSKIPSP
ncbi:MAG: hypothetical protein IRZ31_11085 [Thermogemmatispora sp.]|uniref:hypothetical protein n=1 Tax=Thermogemmatispora sp. TaxID=1968838 RepID=UPI002635176A|nr:hypothetical protein [Thermogemmatispora sp.]MBX5457435.1 hypothetical protein [Thermogemmatispora sp.]